MIETSCPRVARFIALFSLISAIGCANPGIALVDDFEDLRDEVCPCAGILALTEAECREALMIVSDDQRDCINEQYTDVLDPFVDCVSAAVNNAEGCFSDVNECDRDQVNVCADAYFSQLSTCPTPPLNHPVITECGLRTE